MLDSALLRQRLVVFAWAPQDQDAADGAHDGRVGALAQPRRHRLAGVLYFATLPTAGFAYGYVAFMPRDDPAALIMALEAGRQTLAWTVLLGAIGLIDYLVIAALFHRLLAETGKVAADLLVACVIASVPLALAALAPRMDLLALIDAGAADLVTQAPRLLEQEAHLFQLATIFWGLWMMPLGWLSSRSGLVPRGIGFALIAGGFGYLASFVFPLLRIVPPPVITGGLAAVTLASEFAFIAWLVIKGAKPHAPADATAPVRL